MTIQKAAYDLPAMVALCLLGVFCSFYPLLPFFLEPPELNGGVASAYDWLRFLECMLITVAASLSVIGLALARRRLNISPFFLLASVFCFCIGALSIILQPRFQYEAWREWLLFLELALLGVTLRQALIGRLVQASELLVIFVVGGATTYLMWLLLQNHARNWMELPYESFVFLGFVNVRMFADWWGLVLPFLPMVGTQFCTTKISRVACLLLGSLAFALAAVSASRSIIFGQFLGMALLFVVLGWAVFKPILLRSLTYYLTGLGIYLLAKCYVLPSETGFSLFGLGHGRSLGWESLTYTLDRMELWRRAFELANSFPLLGVGPGRFASYPNAIAAAPHNAFLGIAAEWGWPVALLVTAMVGYCFYSSAMVLRGMSRQRKGLDKAFDIAISQYFSMVALFAHAMVSTNVILGAQMQLCLVLLVACFPSRKLFALKGEHAEERGSNRLLMVLGIALTLATLEFVPMIIEDFQNSSVRNAAYWNCEQPTKHFAPRFWQQGWLLDACANRPVSVR